MAPRRWVKRSLQGGAEDSQTACKKEEVETPSLRPSLSTEGASVAVVGGGFAGLFCAERLTELGFDVTLFRARSRLSATQMEHEHNTVYTRPGAAFFDYGCQLITAGDPWFRGRMEAYEAQGLCHKPNVSVLSKTHGLQRFAEPPGWAGTHGMWQFQEQVAEEVIARCKIKLITTATSWPPKVGTRYPDKPLLLDDYHYGPSGWVLGNQKGQSFGPYQVLCGAFNSQTMLNTQLKRPEVSKMRDYLKQIRFQTPIVAMVAFERPLELDFTCAFVAENRCLAWVSNNNRKIAGGRFESKRELWTLIGTADYSYHLFEKLGTGGYKKVALKDFLDSFGELVGRNLHERGPEAVRIMHWEAGVEANTPPSDKGCLWDAEKRLGWCGPWATFASAEGAALSGRCLAEVVAAGGPAEVGYPQGSWRDAACRLRPGYVRLSQGFFYVPGAPDCLVSIDPPATAGTEDHDRFWNAMGGYWIDRDGNEKGGQKGGKSKGKGKGWRQR